jgi:hypothetical protein
LLSEKLCGFGVKISPAVDLEELTQYPCEVEFISLQGELKEAMLWFGEIRSCTCRATLLPEGIELVDLPDPELPIETPQEFLYEPDPAVIRAGMVKGLGALIGASQLDPTIAYLTRGSYQATPFARAYRVLSAMPFNLKTLRAVLRDQQIGNLTVKKRGSAVNVDDFTRRLRLSGDKHATVVLTRALGRQVMLLVEPVEAV